MEDFKISLFLFSFIAGLLTVFAPCVFTLLPVTIGGATRTNDKRNPYIVVLSLALSIIVFSLILRASTILIDIPEEFWKYFSGTILILFGIITLFPKIWDFISFKLGFSNKSNTKLYEASQKKGITGAILIGLSLGPVFSACSPTYALILTTYLPSTFFIGFIYLLAYTIGLSLLLLLIALLGQKFVLKLKWASNPEGMFKKVIGVILIIVGIAIFFGLDKKLEAEIIKDGTFDLTRIEDEILKEEIME